MISGFDGKIPAVKHALKRFGMEESDRIGRGQAAKRAVRELRKPGTLGGNKLHTWYYERIIKTPDREGLLLEKDGRRIWRVSSGPTL